MVLNDAEVDGGDSSRSAGNGNQEEGRTENGSVPRSSVNQSVEDVVAYLMEKLDEAVVYDMIFETMEDAEKFYTAYAEAAGFVTRKNDVKNGKDGEPTKNREWVCNREGFRKDIDAHRRKREAIPETRCGCKASFRVAHDRFTGSYLVTRFESSHNHPLGLPKKRHISDGEKSLLSILTEVGFRPCQVIDYLDILAGGAGNLCFSRKDAYNLLYKLRLEKVRGGDVRAVINLFDSLKLQDPDFFYKLTTDDDDVLTKLFWCDGMSRAEYAEFGDVLIFDSTYKTNKYRYPLVLFSGVNNHKVTCLFAGALMYNETPSNISNSVTPTEWMLQLEKRVFMLEQNHLRSQTVGGSNVSSVALVEYNPFIPHSISKALHATLPTSSVQHTPMSENYKKPSEFNDYPIATHITPQRLLFSPTKLPGEPDGTFIFEHSPVSAYNLPTQNICFHNPFNPTSENAMLLGYLYNASLNLSEPVIQIGPVVVTRGSLLCLKHGDCMNTSVIDALSAQLTLEEKEQSKPLPPTRIILPASFSAHCLHSNGRADNFIVETFLKGPETFASSASFCKHIFIPVNDINDHWFILIIEFDRFKIHICDTYPIPSMKETRLETCKRLVRRVEKLLQMADVGYKGSCLSSFDFEEACWTARHPLMSDSGMYAGLTLKFDIGMCRPLDEEATEIARNHLALFLYKSPYNKFVWTD